MGERMGEPTKHTIELVELPLSIVVVASLLYIRSISHYPGYRLIVATLIVVMVFLFLGAVKHWGIWRLVTRAALMLVGVGCNAAAIFLHGGWMPVYGLHHPDGLWRPVLEGDTHLWLVDRFGSFSIGDLVLIVGLIVTMKRWSWWQK